VLEAADYGTFELSLATGHFGRAAEPDVAVLLLDEGFFLPRDWNPADIDAVAEQVKARLGELRGLLTAQLSAGSATVFLHTVPLPREVSDTVLAWRSRAQLARVWHELNADLLALADEHRNVVVADLVGLLADAPVRARDERLHRYGDLPYTDGALLLLAQQVRRVVQARAGRSRKVLALDLDNTLWGGVLGEVGAAGVELGGLYPGNCYLALQRTARRLREQGVILVLASKNDAVAVDAALAGHPEAALRRDDFSVRAVNWSAKAGNLRAAADRLALSAGSFVFMDDSPFELGEVALALPEVALVSAAGEPAHLARSLLRHGWFDSLALTTTDRERPQLYRDRAQRDEYASGFSTPHDYLRALAIELEIAPVTEFSVPRVAQLAARTNQYNLTGIRFDEAQTAELAARDDRLVCSFSVEDRFGSEGIVGAFWAARDADEWRVLNFVMSCRVLGREIELAVVGRLARQAREAGARTLRAEFVPSAANSVAADLWTRAGFTDEGGGRYALDLTGAPATLPDWISLRERTGSNVY
jgi:FkbH-like protein